MKDCKRHSELSNRHTISMTYPTISIPISAKESSRPRLLIVNEDPLTRELHTLVLHLVGYDVETACDGATALERLAVEPFDVVVTNRAMPILDGASMILALRSAGSEVPIVMVSGPLSESPLPQLVACEISAVVPKPARTNEILSAVAHALRPSAGHREDLESPNRSHARKERGQNAVNISGKTLIAREGRLFRQPK
jgi:DNA-binding response OmpR family regulator